MTAAAAAGVRELARDVTLVLGGISPIDPDAPALSELTRILYPFCTHLS